MTAVLLAAAALATSCGAERPQPPGGRFLVYTWHLNVKRSRKVHQFPQSKSAPPEGRLEVGLIAPTA